MCSQPFRFCSQISSFTDISQLPSDDPAQPILSRYPKKMQGGFNRSFNLQWFKSCPWLEYSQNEDAAFCFACRHFGSSEDLSFVEVGFSNWKNAKASKSKGLNGHACSDCHINAIVAWSEYKRMQSSSTSVGQILNEAHQRAVEENRYYVKTVAEILYTGRQSIAQRGHREQDDAAAGLNEGNFLELLNLIGKHDSKIAEKIEGLNENGKYTSPRIQNEVLQILADMVREQIMEEVKTRGQLALILDETKDVSKIEQISFVLRYFYNESAYESFLTFQAAEYLDARSLTKKIFDCLDDLGLDYKQNLVGQCYDGASAMSGKNSGVAATIQKDR